MGGGSVAKGQAGPAADAPSRRFDRDERGDDATCCAEKKTARPGLGTEWGEERYSAVDFTRFERANQSTPSALAELRYNDAEGLRALGVILQPAPDSNEIEQRETANPFPARGFAAPPQ
jgi:hypothetical protein